jgi:hypothetical protein
MARRLPISEVVKKAGTLRSKQQKLKWLQENDTIPLRIILRLWYDENIEFLIPDSAPPYKEGATSDEGMMLYHEARKLRIFVKGGGYDNLEQAKRESLFIGLLEDVCDEDSEMLCQMITREKVKGLTKQTVEEGLPRIFIDPLKMS